MQFDSNKSIEQNFADLLNLKAAYPHFKGEHLVLGTPSTITPGSGNGFKNTQVAITPVSSFFLTYVETIVQYNRIALSSSRSGIGSKVVINGASSHTDVFNRIAEVHNVLLSGLTQTTPAHPPRPGQEQTYRLTPPSTHYVYTTTARDFLVTNTGPKLELPSGIKLFLAYPFNDNPLTDVRDHVTNIALTNSGTVYNTNSTTLARSIRFNGTTSYVLVPKELIPNLNILNGDFTIEMWIKPNTTKTNQPIISQWKDGSNPEGFSLVLNNFTPQFYFAPASTSALLVQGGAIFTDTFYHLALSRQGITFRIFVNGNMTGTIDSSASNTIGSSLDWILGQTLSSSGVPTGTGSGSAFVPAGLDADIRELAVWNSAKYTTAFTPAALV